MEQLTESQLAACANARDALARHAAFLPAFVAQVNADTALPWVTDAAAFFGALGDRAADLWRDNGKRVEFALHNGAAYADMTKPAKVCGVCADGHVVPSAVAFPASLLAVWHVPCATKADALALIAQGNSAVLAALVAAQSEQAP